MAGESGGVGGAQGVKLHMVTIDQFSILPAL